MLVTVTNELSRWAIPALLLLIPLSGALRGVRVYESFVTGAQDGFKTAIAILPFMVGMLVTISVFRDSGAMDLLANLLDPVMRLLRTPAEVIPLAIMRPLSGGGSLAVAADLISTHGPDSFIGRLASTMQGSTDTTFYILTVYFGSVGIRKFRYALTLGLLADISGLIASIAIVNYIFG